MNNNTDTISAKVLTHSANWRMGTLSGAFTGCKFQALVFDEASHFGVNGGRISKLWVATVGDEPTVLYSFDRGDVEVGNLTDEGINLIVEAIETAVRVGS